MIFFLIGDDLLFVSQKVDTELSQPPTSQARPPDRPATALKLGSEDSQLSRAYALQVWW